MFESISNSFNSISKKTLKGVLHSVIKSVSTCENNTLLSFINEQVTALRNEIDCDNQILQIFSLLSDTISSDNNAFIGINTQDIAEITRYKDTVKEGCEFIKSNFGGRTITDSLSLIYNFVFDEYDFVENGVHYRSILSSCIAPQSTKQSIIFIDLDTSKMYLNAVVRTADFNNPDEQIEVTTLASKLSLILKTRNLDFNGTLQNNYDSSLYYYFLSLGGNGDTLFDILSDIEVQNVKQGKVRYLWDIVKELVASNELNCALLDTMSSITQGQETFKTWISTVALYTVNSVECVKEFFLGLCNAYTSGGFKGAIMYVYSFFETAASATDEDGLLVFTNNKNFIPAEYVVGMIGQIVSTAVAAAGAIISYFQPIIGALASLIGGVGMGIFKSIQYDESATRCGIQTSDRVAINGAPFAIGQTEFNLEIDSDLYNFINSTPVFTLEVPGGYLLCGPGGYGTGSLSNKVTSIRVEFHPALYDRCESITTFAQSMVSVTSEQHSGQESDIVYLKAENSTVQLDYQALQYWLETEFYSPEYVSSYVMSNGSNDRLSAVADQRMRRIVMCNTWLFTYWAIVSTMSDKDTVYYIEPVNSGNNDYFAYSSSNLVGKDMYFKTDVAANVLAGLCPGVTSPDLYTVDPNWDDIVSKMLVPLMSIEWITPAVTYIVKNNMYSGMPISMPYAFDYALVPAKYNVETFQIWILLTAVVTVAVATLAVAVTYKVRKSIQSKRAEQNRNVEDAWSKYSQGAISYDEYRKTVRTANRWQMVIGGTKYDYENYWNGDVKNPNKVITDDDFSTVSAIKSKLNAPQNEVHFNGETYDVNELFTKILHSLVG